MIAEYDDLGDLVYEALRSPQTVNQAHLLGAADDWLRRIKDDGTPATRYARQLGHAAFEHAMFNSRDTYLSMKCALDAFCMTIGLDKLSE